MSTSQSQYLLKRAKQVIPGGVNSPVRAFGAVGGDPLFIESASGCSLVDADGREYIDYVGSWGPMILGHARPEVIEAIQSAASRGTSYGAPTALEVDLAEKVCSLVPSIEKLRLVNSGTEAAMSALRLARAFTGRSIVMKFDGCYHGHSDSFLVQAGSGVATFGLPNSPGVPPSSAEQTLSLPFNNLAAVEEAFSAHPDQIAAVILEPVTGNMGVIVPPVSFLERLREMTRKHGALLIFDEVMTGFRLSLGGAQQLCEVKPDLTCLGKIVGGGMPIGAFGGRKDIMSRIAPEGDVYQAGTLSGNPVAVAAGLKTLEILEAESPYAALERFTMTLCAFLEEAAQLAGVDVRIQQCGSMFTIFFSEGPVSDFEAAKGCDTQLFSRFFHLMLDAGIYLAPSQFEACFVSTAHDQQALEATVGAAENAFKQLAA